jgi:hypothetical protein
LVQARPELPRAARQRHLLLAAAIAGIMQPGWIFQPPAFKGSE